MVIKEVTQTFGPVKKLINFGRVFRLTFRRDLKGLRALIITQYNLRQLKRSNSTVSSVFSGVVAKYHDKPALIHQGKSWTYKELDEFSNRIAQAFTAAGYKSGDEVALLMESRPEFVGIWLGLSKIGCVTALLNTNLKSQTLLHSTSVVKTRALIYESILEPVVKDLLKILPPDSPIEIYSYGNNLQETQSNNKIKQLESILKLSSSQPVNYKGNFSDRLLYIYTSGTTGLPKAAIITNARFFVFGSGIHLVTEMKPNDILYTPLPLYHFAGGVLGLSQCLLYGNSMVLRHKFSASAFWDDCIENNCTVAQYIGELTRYLLTQEPSEKEKKHKVRCVYGNGFRPTLWAEFRQRFNIPKIVEFYGATEGNGSVVNVDNHDGACGFMSVIFPDWLLNKIYPISLIRVNEETGEPIRNDKGLCIKCKPGEIGQFVGLIKNKDPIKRFDGYADEKATSKKIVKNVFKKGDAYFASGDLLVMDELGYLYFKDRTGDTFRWKGENVATGEVEGVISSITNLSDCVVYGVQLAGHEGRAGMAAISDPNKSLNLENLLTKMKEQLPSYAIPVFIRLVDTIEITSTFKIPKVSLQKESFDINLVKDPIYFLDSKSQKYVKIDQETFNKLNSGEISL